MKKKTKIISSLLVMLLFIVGGVIFILSTTIIIKSKKNPYEIPDIFGYKPMIVLSGSMESEISAGDLAIVKEVDLNTLKINDIIAFREADNTVTTHRIVNKRKLNDQYFFETKGDSNKNVDENIVSYSQVEGLYLYKINGFGNVFMFVQKPLGLAVILLTILIIGITGEVKDNKESIHIVDTSNINQAIIEKTFNPISTAIHFSFDFFLNNNSDGR